MRKPLIALTPESVTRARADGPGSFCLVSYSQAVEAAGGVPWILPLTADRELLDHCLRQCQALMLTGGGDVSARFYGADLPAAERETIAGVDEVRDTMELHLVRAAERLDVPVLGICRGIQVMNVAFGGTLIPDIPLRRPDALPHRHQPPDALTHPITWTNEARQLGCLADACPAVNTSHHQALDRVAPGFAVVARAPDGIIEAIEKPGTRFFCGVQFHPERLRQVAPQVERLFAALVAAAAGSGRAA